MALLPKKQKGGIELEDNSSLSFYEASASGTSKLTLTGPAALSGDVSLTLPSADGSAGQVLQTNGSGTLSFANAATAKVVSTYSTTQTIPNTDDVVLCNATSAAFTVTLPAAASNSGKQFFIKKTDSTLSAVTIDGNASETIDGATTTTLNTQNETVIIVSDGSNWEILERRIPSVRTSFTPVWENASSTPSIGNGVLEGWWKRMGDCVEIYCRLEYGSTTTGGTGTTWWFGLPSGITVDTAKIGTNSAANDYTHHVGMGSSFDNASGSKAAQVIFDESPTPASLSQAVFMFGADGTGNFQPALPFTWTNPDSLEFRYIVPVSGWNG